MQAFKRYLIGIFFFIILAVLMLLGTYGVEKMGNGLLKETGAVMQPRGEKL